jgi:cytochrome c-type biogenesis protein CcmH
LVRERLKAGDSDDQVVAFIESRYGEFVLLRPPLETQTLLLWLGPLLVLLIAVGAGLRAVTRRPAPAASTAALTSVEEQKLKALIDEPEDEKRA